MIEEKEKNLIYIAGFIDSNNCELNAKIIRHNNYPYKFKITLSIIMYVKTENYWFLLKLLRVFTFNWGRIIRKECGVFHYMINIDYNIKNFLCLIKDYVILKKDLVNLLLKIIEEKQKIKTLEDFIEVCKLIDKFNELKIYGNGSVYEDFELEEYKKRYTQKDFKQLLKNFVKVKDDELDNYLRIMKLQEVFFLNSPQKEAKTSVDVINYWNNKQNKLN